ncbi:MAG: type II toxin-antitoxin system VapC family toxin [Rhodoferax sp.]|nr:type II toxin-antitoxin system VapC family toxin [Rhodoferax sp.]
MMYLVDTNIVSHFVRASSPELTRRILESEADSLCISTISAGELLYGLGRLPPSRRAQTLRQQLDAVFNAIAVAPMPTEAAAHYGTVRSALEKVGNPIGANDLWIAAHALAQGLTLVTNNTREFKRVKGLKVEDWV